MKLFAISVNDVAFYKKIFVPRVINRTRSKYFSDYSETSSDETVLKVITVPSECLLEICSKKTRK